MFINIQDWSNLSWTTRLLQNADLSRSYPIVSSTDGHLTYTCEVALQRASLPPPSFSCHVYIIQTKTRKMEKKAVGSLVHRADRRPLTLIDLI